MKERFTDKWKEDALAYIDREHSEERRAYLARLNPHSPPEEWALKEHRTPKGVLIESVVRQDGFVERWRMTYGEIVVESPFDVSFADVTISASGYEWETFIDAPGLEQRL